MCALAGKRGVAHCGNTRPEHGYILLFTMLPGGPATLVKGLCASLARQHQLRLSYHRYAAILGIADLRLPDHGARPMCSGVASPM
jgi:hypothetical protein